MAIRRRTNKVDINALVDLYERCAGIDVHKELITDAGFEGTARRLGLRRVPHLRRRRKRQLVSIPSQCSFENRAVVCHRAESITPQAESVPKLGCGAKAQPGLPSAARGMAKLPTDGIPCSHQLVPGFLPRKAIPVSLPRPIRMVLSNAATNAAIRV